MRSIIKKILLFLGVGKLYNKLYDLYDSASCKKIECSIGDILLLRDVPNGSQLLLTSRLLDVDAYLGQGDETFPYQNTISRKKYGNNHNEEGGNSSFKALIESYKKFGYNQDSYITCDKNMVLMDGNHRMGLQIHEHIEKVNVRIVGRKWPDTEALDSYYERLFPTAFMERIFQRFSEIQKWLIGNGMTFCAYLKSENQEGINLLNDMRHLCNVLDVKETKCEGVIVCFSMFNPQYIVKDNQLFSNRAAKIENILIGRKCAGDEVIVSKNCLEGKQLYDKYLKTV